VLRLTGSGGFVSGELENLFSLDSRVWSIGPSLSIPLFAGGRNQANLQRSQAAYAEAVARYRQQILVAFGEVESSLSGLHHLAKQAEAQARAVASRARRRAAELANERYKGGIVSYLEVVDANRATLQVERAAAQLTGQRLLASVLLIKSLGGGWDSAALLSQATAQPSSGSK
jgi:outer membrane protein, multidrug efflux system